MAAELTTHRDVGRRAQVLVLLCLVIANVVGAAIVLALAGWVLPTRELALDGRSALDRNVELFGLYLVAAVVVGIGWGRLWVRVPPPPGADEPESAWTRHRRRGRRTILGAPLRLAVVQAVPWLVAVAVFGGLNAQDSWLLGAVVVCVVALGGLATVAVAHRLSDLALRHDVARVLAVDPPRRRSRVTGVRVRAMGAWVLGTGVPLLGVTLVAATSMLLPQYYTVAGLGLAVLVLSLVALAVGSLLMALTSTSIAGPVVAVSRGLRRIERGDLDVRLPVSDTTELGVLQAGFNTMVEGLRERDRVRALFGRQVGEDVAQAAIEGGVELGGEVCEVAVLFVDLVGSTRMALDLPPQEVVAVLNAFFGEVVDVVESHGGWINKFEGDAALAVFGAPSALEDSAGRALAAARALAARLDRPDGSGRPRVEFGIGVSAGPVVAGNIGDRRRYEYTVIGDPVNEAARLSDLAKTLPGAVAASDQALARTTGTEGRDWTVVETRRLRGRTADTEISAPVG